MKISKLPISGYFTLMSLFGPLHAASIAVANFNFEIGGGPDNSFTNNPGVIPTGWTAIGGGLSGSFYGYFNPDNSTYTGTSGVPGTIGTMDGPNVFYFGSALPGQGIQQTVGANYEADTNYNLTVAVGTRILALNQNDLEVQLLAGSTVVANEIFTPGVSSSFTDRSLIHLADAGNVALYGQPLTIRFLERGTNFEVDIDNVRLTSTPVPEPSSVILLLSLAGASFLRRR